MIRTRLRSLHSDDRGSLPMALLAVIALSAVMGALVLTTISSSQAARFDLDYTASLQAADAGAQQGEAKLMRGYDADTLRAHGVPPGCTRSAWAACPVFDSGAGTVDGATFAWEARKVDELRWFVRSTGRSPSDVDRTVVVEVGDSPRFFVAAFSDLGMTLAGGNGADSYGSSAWFTGNGVVGSNESIQLNGGSTGVDAVQLYDWDNNPDFGRCDHSGGSDCDDVLAVPSAIEPSGRIGPRLVVGGSVLDTQFIDDQLALCPAPLTDYTATTHAGGSGVLGTAGTTTTLCFETVTFDRDVTILGNVEIYVYRDMLVSNHVMVNCAGGCAAGTSTPDARTLQIFVDGSGDPSNPSAVALGNHSAITAGIYAPESTCAGNPSNAQGDIFGSMICGTIANQGGWGFHYDDRLGEEGTGVYARVAWREENT